ncbi:MAG: helix-turn-helix domain-containing protein [Sphingomonadales bacterium]|nr:helix-turn-helix domain-containing protein [Sphingomonadales bacterium]
MDADGEPPAALPETVGQRLARAREAAGRTLAGISVATKIPEKSLAAIEHGDLAALPSRIYTIGFSRSYARLVGLDEAEIARAVREELYGAAAPAPEPEPAFAPGDPARAPGRRLVLACGVLLLAVFAGIALFWHSAFDPGGTLPSILPRTHRHPHPQAPARAAPKPPAAPPVAATGTVRFTALAPGIWVKIYEAGGKVLLERQMKLGESYDLPADARAPLLWTGRPEALAIAVGGRPVAALSATQKTLKDVPVSAAALAARPLPAPAPASTAVPSPASTAPPR